MRTLAQAEVQQPFDLTQGPLLRATLVRLTDVEHVLLLTMHHIVSDGWSHGVFWRELAMLYEAFTTGQPSPLPALPIQYADFAHWQQQWLQGEVLDTQLTYWKQQLAGVSTLQLPTDYPRPAVQTFRGARHVLTFVPDTDASAQDAESAARGHLVHDLAGSLPDPATPLHWSGRHRGGLAHRQSRSGRDRRV